MSLDVLALGPVLFDQWSTPETLPLGGKHQMKLHKMPGGNRRADMMGLDDRDRQFAGIHMGSTALADAQLLDALRIAGQPLPYSNGAEARTVVIADFTWDVEKFNVIHFNLTLTPIDNPTSGAAMTALTDSLAASDLGAADNTIATNVGATTSAYPVTTPIGSGGIGSA